MDRIEIGDVKFYPFEDRGQLIAQLVEERKKMLFAVNARKIMTSPDSLKKTISNHIGYIDGHGAIWAAKRMGYNGEIARIPGVELWLDIIKHVPGKKYYFLGAKQEVLEEVVQKLKAEYPQIKIAGYRNGYFDEHELANIGQDIETSGADFVFVAMGSPLQENVMIKLYDIYETTYMGVGGSFDVYSGNVQRAPVIFQKLGLEGFYRFASNPKRLFDREIFYFRYFRKLLTGNF